jgi:hypothetical protein
VIAQLVARTGDRAETSPASFDAVFEHVASRIGSYGALLDGGLPTRKGAMLRLVQVDINSPPHAELTVRVSPC